MEEAEYEVGPLVDFEWVDDDDGQNELLMSIYDCVEVEGYQVFLPEEEALQLYLFLKRKFEPLIN